MLTLLQTRPRQVSISTTIKAIPADSFASICPDGELREGIRGQRVLAGTEVGHSTRRPLPHTGCADSQDLHKRIADLEDALRQSSSPSHPLLRRTIRQNNETSENIYPGGSLVTEETTLHAGAMDRLSSYSHLVEDEPGRSRYYGAASSVYLTVSDYTLPLASPVNPLKLFRGALICVLPRWRSVQHLLRLCCSTCLLQSLPHPLALWDHSLLTSCKSTFHTNM